MNDSTYVCVMFPYPPGSGLHIGQYFNNKHKGVELPPHACHRIVKILRVFAPGFKLEG